MTADVVVVDRLVKRYGAAVALAGISLEVRQGEFIALLGPSGCGKTTLLRSIAGFIEPSSGEIFIGGRPMAGVPPNKRPVNTVFQQYALFPHMSVAENVAFGPRRRRLPAREIEARVASALATVGLEALGSRLPRELSGGQQQRVALARAIVNQPQVLLLDEPLGALDLKLRKRMQVELKRLHRQLGLTFLFVTHDQEEALAMADRIAVMREGAIVQLGSGRDIYHNPTSRYVADFIGEANLLDCDVASDGSLRLAGGGPVIPYRAEGRSNGRISLMVRPEAVLLGPAVDPSSHASLGAILKEKTFTGAAWRCYLTVPGGQEVAAAPADGTSVEKLAPGDAIELCWRREAARVLAG